MAATFPFELVSPERLLFSGQVTEVIVPGTEGEFGIMAGHAPFVSTLKPGILVIKGDGAPRKLFVRAGFAEANPKGLTVLAEAATPLEELHADHLARLVKDAAEDVEDARDEATRLRRQAMLDQLKAAALALESEGRSPH